MASTHSFHLNNRVTQLAKRISELPIPSNIPTLDGDNTFTSFNQFDQIPITQTAPVGDNSDKIATTEYVEIAINNIVNPDLLVLDNTFIGTNDFTNQVSFSLPPHSEPPILGNDLATKGYVDSLVGQYSGGYNLFLNYSQPVVVGGIDYFSLSKTVSSATQQSILTPTNGGEHLLVSFISDELNISEIPAGLFDLFLYGAVSSVNQIVYYHFHLKKYSAGIITSISVSGNSKDVNASPSSNPEVYLMNATISSAIPLLLTDRIIIEIYYNKTAGTSVDLTTYFESAYYSFLQTTLNAGTTLLTSNNNWTASNNFVLSPTVPTVVSSDNSTKVASTEFVNTAVSNIVYPFVGTADSDLNMNGFNITSPSAITIGNVDINTNLEGVVNVKNDLIVGSGASNVRLFGGDGGDTFDTTTQNDIQVRLAGESRNQIYNAVILNTTTGTGTIILPSILNAYYVYIINNSASDWTIKPQVGEFMRQGLAGGGVGNPSGGIIVRAFQTFGFLQLDSGTEKYSLIVSEAINGTSPTFSTILCNAYEGKSNNTVNFATFLASAVNISKPNINTSINGRIRLGTNAGTAGQVITSAGASTDTTWTTPYISPDGLAVPTISLDMNNNSITNTSSIASSSTLSLTSTGDMTIGNVDINTNLEGVVNVKNDLIIGSGASTVRLFGGDGGDTFDTTTQNDIQLRLAGRNRNQIYNAVIPITTTALGTIILPTALNGYYVYIINGSNFDWFIKPQVGEFIGQGLGGSGVGNPSSGIIIRAFQTFGFVQLVSTVSYNLIVNEAINGTQPTFGSIFCNVYEGRNPSAVVPFATAVGSGVRIGKATFPSTIQGFVQLPNLAVSNYAFRRNTVVQAIPSGSDTVVLFPSLITSSTTSSLTYLNGVFTNNTAGNIMCQITYSVGFGANSSGIRTTKILCSTYGVSGGIQMSPLPSNITTLNGSVILSVPAGITFNLTAFQSSGASINLDLNLTSIQILVL